MEIILREDVEKLGTRGQVVKVASGYARNFLLPKRLAVAATESNKKIVEQERQAHLRREAKVLGDAQDLAKLMASVSVTIAQKAGENDVLFGSVTAKDIADSIEKQGFRVERRQIQLAEPIKQLGEHKVPLRLHREVTIEIPVNVVRQEDEKSRQEAEKTAATAPAATEPAAAEPAAAEPAATEPTKE